MRMAVASLLRVVVAACIALAVLVLCLSLLGVALVALGQLELSGGLRATEPAAWTGVIVGLLLAPTP